jgi:two-component system nitrogen regulation response regulator GlnG
VRHFLRRFSSVLGREVRQVSPEVLEHLGHYAWPGNIRELQSVLKQALLQASGAVLLPGQVGGTTPGNGTMDESQGRLLNVSLRPGSPAQRAYCARARAGGPPRPGVSLIAA